MPRRDNFARLRQAGGRRLLAGGLWALLAAVAGLFTIQVSLAAALRDELPQFALGWVPYDGEARASLAGVLSGVGSSARARAVARNLAREAIVRTPLSVVALRSLALAAAAEGGSKERPSALMIEAERLSRRDFPTEQWLIEQALRKGDVPQAMRHFDIAMRSSVDSRQFLFPMLANASADPRISTALEVRLRERPEWRFGFVNYMASYETNPTRGLAFAREFLNPAVPDERAVLVAYIARLASAGKFAEAWDLYQHFHFGTANTGVQDGGFEARDGIAPFAWQLTQDADLEAYREPSPAGKGQALALSANSGRGGVVARQLLKLAPGSYTFRATVGDVPTDSFERPQVAIACASETRSPDLLALSPPAAGEAARPVAGSFSVPSGCGFQWLSLSIAGDGPAGDAVPWIDDIAINRSSGARPPASDGLQPPAAGFQ